MGEEGGRGGGLNLFTRLNSLFVVFIQVYEACIFAKLFQNLIQFVLNFQHNLNS